jgi:hypothetical protein
MQWFAMDVDPRTRKVTERNLLLMQPNTVAPVGQAVFRLGKTNVNPATRQVGFRLSSGTSTGAGGLTAGQFIQPIFNFIFPELLAIGSPMLENRFDVIPFLGKGSGPYVPGQPGFPAPAAPVIVGQLSPWPGSLPPTTTICPVLIISAAATTTVITSTTSTTAAPNAAPPVDTITIESAAASAKRGATIVTVTATTNANDPTNKLFLNVNGVTPIANAAMNPMAGSPGKFSLVITVKGKPGSYICD